MKTSSIKEKVRFMMEEQHLLDVEPFKLVSRRFPQFPIAIASLITDECLDNPLVEVQRRFINSDKDSRSIVTDVVIRTRDGRIFNLEPNTYRHGGIIERGLFHSYIIGATLLKHGEDWQALRKGGVILLNKYDVLGKGKALSVFRMREDGTGTSASEKGMSIYVANCSHKGDGPYGKLYHDLMVNYLREETCMTMSRNAVEYLLEKEVQKNMTERQEMIIREIREETEKEVTLDNARALLNKGVDAKMVSEALNISARDMKSLGVRVE